MQNVPRPGDADPPSDDLPYEGTTTVRPRSTTATGAAHRSLRTRRYVPRPIARRCPPSRSCGFRTGTRTRRQSMALTTCCRFRARASSPRARRATRRPAGSGDWQVVAARLMRVAGRLRLQGRRRPSLTDPPDAKSMQLTSNKYAQRLDCVSSKFIHTMIRPIGRASVWKM